MVNTGKPSMACATCKTRRIKVMNESTQTSWSLYLYSYSNPQSSVIGYSPNARRVNEPDGRARESLPRPMSCSGNTADVPRPEPLSKQALVRRWNQETGRESSACRLQLQTGLQPSFCINTRLAPSSAPAPAFLQESMSICRSSFNMNRPKERLVPLFQPPDLPLWRMLELQRRGSTMHIVHTEKPSSSFKWICRIQPAGNLIARWQLSC